MGIVEKVWSAWTWPARMLCEWKYRRWPDVREAWIAARCAEIGDDCRNEDGWIMWGWKAKADWRVAQHRSWLGLRHRVNRATDGLIIAVGIALTFSPLLALLAWVVSHLHVAVQWR
jgi:hypothetical protein